MPGSCHHSLVTLLVAFIFVDSSLSLPARAEPPPIVGSPGAALPPAPNGMATLADGTVLTLVGVTVDPTKARTWAWWKPDGAPLSEPPFDPLPAAKRGVYFTGDFRSAQLRDFVFRLDNPAHRSVSLEWEVKGTHETVIGLGGYLYKHGLKREDLYPIAAAFPWATRRATICVGVASGDWETVKELKLEDPRPFALSSGVAGFSVGWDAKQPVNHTNVTMLTQIDFPEAHTEYQVVAIDRAGKIYKPHFDFAVANGQSLTTGLHFDLPLAQIEMFELQERPYQWLEFRDVHLQPGTPGVVASL